MRDQQVGGPAKKLVASTLKFVRISKILVIDVFCMGFPRPLFKLAVWNKGAVVLLVALKKFTKFTSPQDFLQPCEYNGSQRDGGSTLQSLLP